ncbi:MAG: alpha/beta fold hydrolase [Actinomycetota bacterium]
MGTTEVDGVRISYTDTGGSGTPVVFIHAFPLSAEMWEPQVEALRDRARLVTVDLRGFGDSDAPEDRDSYSVSIFARDVKGALDDAGVERAVLCGLSMGGYVAFEFWRRYRDAVAGLILADTRAEADAPEGVEKRTGQQQQVADNGIEELADALTTALLSETTREAKPDVVKRARSLMNQPAAGYIGALEALKKRPDSTADLAGIDVPCTVIVGEHDGLTPPEMSRKIHEHVAGSQLVVIPDAGHLSSLEDPQAFNGGLADFLTRL